MIKIDAKNAGFAFFFCAGTAPWRFVDLPGEVSPSLAKLGTFLIYGKLYHSIVQKEERVGVPLF